jgi:UDP-N-acetylglucosamine--N-acetylmuramyl-(pentapeptide) pyrophosphoryl-undecaprenol N-acetylglucosamine transferase
MSAASHAHTDPHAPLVVLAGGGSGGHVFPALAVGEELARRGWRVSAMGSLRGMEAELYTRHGVPFDGLPAEPVVGQGLAGRLSALRALWRGTLAAARRLDALDARAVVATGGYAAAPAMVAARLLGRPLLLVEPNAAAGLTSRLLSFCCREAAVAHSTTVDQLACPAAVTGVPLRPAFSVPPQPLPALAPPWRLLVLGGSQGAVSLNRTLPAAACALARELAAPLVIVHQAGARHLDTTRAAWDATLAAHRATGEVPAVTVEVVAFLPDVAAALAACHLVVSRAGAITLAEICASARGSVLLPLALAGGHQQANAEALAAAGAARILATTGAATPEPLTALLREVLAQPEQLVTMAAAARALAQPAAAARIADRVEALAELPAPTAGRKTTAAHLANANLDTTARQVGA